MRGVPSRFDIAVDIGNPTSVPLTLESVSATIDGKSFSFAAGNVLAPGDPPQMAEFPITLAQDQQALCEKYRLVLLISGSVTYVDGFRERKEQTFGQRCAVFPDNQATFGAFSQRRHEEVLKESGAAGRKG
jgi:hypothetical protein